MRAAPVSYTHLDVYKRQQWMQPTIRTTLEDSVTNQNTDRGSNPAQYTTTNTVRPHLYRRGHGTGYISPGADSAGH